MQNVSVILNKREAKKAGLLPVFVWGVLNSDPDDPPRVHQIVWV